MKVHCVKDIHGLEKHLGFINIMRAEHWVAFEIEFWQVDNVKLIVNQ